jgi:hypothetical protein
MQQPMSAIHATIVQFPDFWELSSSCSQSTHNQRIVGISGGPAIAGALL